MTERPTVLVVEDDRDLADLYETWLTDEYDVRVAYAVEDARDVIDDDVDVALVDRRLPDGTGDELVGDIQESSANIRVALVTGVEPDFDIIDLGFDAYVVKPVSRDDLHDVVQRLLARAVYSDEIREFFALASKRATLETEKSAEELAESDAYQDLVHRIQERRGELHDLVVRMTQNDVVAVFRELDGAVDE